MSDGGHGMVDQHTRTCPPHHPTYTFLHLGAIAVDRTFLTRLLPLSKAATSEARMSVGEQSLAFGTQCSVSFLVLAIEAYHLFHNAFFFIYSVHLWCFFKY